MTCVDVMCKTFGSTFPAYPRTVYSGDLSHCQSFSKMQKPLDLGAPQSSSLPLTSLPYPGSSSLTSSSLTPSSTSPRSAVIVPSALTTSPGATLPLVKGEVAKEPNEPKIAHYLGVNCVLFTYFSGDTSAVVDDHFTRALNQSTGYNPSSSQSRSKDISNKASIRPMSSRNLPPSFWNSSYQAQASPHFLGQGGHNYPGSSSSVLGGSSELASFHSAHPYLSPALHGLSNLQADPWAYSLSSTSSAMGYPHRPVPYDLSYPTSSRFSQNYNPFLMQPSAVRSGHFGAMSGHCDVSKASEPNRTRFSEHRFGTDYGACTAMDTAGGLQETTKDLYWF